MKTVYISTSLLAAVVSLCGCASVYDSDHPPIEGWHMGRIDQIGSAADLGHPREHDCRKGMSEEYLASHSYAMVDYLVGRRPHDRIVPLPAESSFKAGDKVYVNSLRCDSAIAERAS